MLRLGDEIVGESFFGESATTDDAGATVYRREYARRGPISIGRDVHAVAATRSLDDNRSIFLVFR